MVSLSGATALSLEVVLTSYLDPCMKKLLNMTASRSSCVRVAIPPTVQRIKSVLSEEGHQITNWSVAFCTTPKWLEGIHLCPSETGEGL